MTKLHDFMYRHPERYIHYVTCVALVPLAQKQLRTAVKVKTSNRLPGNICDILAQRE